jgi:hypothetical protein
MDPGIGSCTQVKLHASYGSIFQVSSKQWRTLPIIVGGAKSHYIKVEGANLKYFIFYMVKTYKY